MCKINNSSLFIANKDENDHRFVSLGECRENLQHKATEGNYWKHFILSWLKLSWLSVNYFISKCFISVTFCSLFPSISFAFVIGVICDRDIASLVWENNYLQIGFRNFGKHFACCEVSAWFSHKFLIQNTFAPKFIETEDWC